MKMTTQAGFGIMRPFVRAGAMLQLALLGSLSVPGAFAGDLPTGITSQVGAISVSQPNANTLNIQTYQDRTIFNAVDFSVGAGNTVNVNQPGSSSAALGRVTGGNVTAIYGTLNSNGSLILINPNGVLVGAGGVVNTQSFTASTLDISNTAFLAGGTQVFSGTSEAAVVNLGTITANGGDVFLIAKHVSNSGAITAANGTVGLAAGTEVTLSQGGDNRLSVRLDSGAGSSRSGVGVENSGTINALKAELAANGNIYSLAVNNTGLVRATAVSNVGGRIRITASGGTAANSGTLAATNGTKGGEVDLTAHDIHLASTSVIDVSGANGGGTAKIGGGAQGKDASIENATNVTVDAGSVIKADAADTGDGGTVVVWGDGSTVFQGTISARGGANGGDGGSVEVSSAGAYDFDGLVDTRAPHGTGGTLLLDPTELYIYSSSGSFNTSSKTTLRWQTIQNNLATNSNLVVQTQGYGTSANDNGSLIIADGFTMNTSSNLTFSAAGSITVNATDSGGAALTISNTGSGNLTFIADRSAYGTDGTGTTVSTAQGGHGTISQGGTINYAGKVTFYYDPTTYGSQTTYSGVTATGGFTAYMLVNTAQDLADVATAVNANTGGAASANYALNADVDLSTVNGGNWTPIGNASNHFSGKFTASVPVSSATTKTISNISVSSATNGDYVGLFGYIQNATISSATLKNVTLNGTMTSNGHIGSVAGYADSSTISGVSLSGSTNTINAAGSTTAVGGLVGEAVGTTSVSGSNNATITLSSSAATSYAGGLVGKFSSSAGTLSGSNSGAIVDDGDSAYAGGLVGLFDSSGGTLSGSNSAAISGSGALASIGGIAGYISGSGTLSSLSNTGAVSGSGTSALVGGLVGKLDGTRTITKSKNTGTVSASGSSSRVGGLAGTAVAGTTISNSYNTATVTGSDTVGGLVGDLGGTLDTTYNSGAVRVTVGQTASAVGGLAGILESTGLIVNSFQAGAVNTSGSYGTATLLGGLVGNDLSVSATTTTTVTSSGGTSATTTSTDSTGTVLPGTTTSTSGGTTVTATTKPYTGIWTTYWGSSSNGTSTSSLTATGSSSTSYSSSFDGTFGTDIHTASWYTTSSNWTLTTWSTTTWSFSSIGSGFPVFVSGGGGGGGGSSGGAISGDPNAEAAAKLAAASAANAGAGQTVRLSDGSLVVLNTSATQPDATFSTGNGADGTVGGNSLGGAYSLAGTKPWGTPGIDETGGHREYAPNFDIPTLPGALQHVRTISNASNAANQGAAYGHAVLGGTHGTMSYTDPNH